MIERKPPFDKINAGTILLMTGVLVLLLVLTHYYA